MAELNAADLFKTLIGALQGTFKDQWPKIKDFAEGEAKKLARSLVDITKLKLTGQITEDECAVLLEIQKNTARTVMLSVEGMGLILVEQAINAAIKAVSDVVNGAIGFKFI